jgi:apolipoprotein N-acyltransferase
VRALSLLLPTAASAVLYGLAFPPTGLRPLAWVALVPFLAAVRRARPGGALLLAWAWTVLAAYVVGEWFPRSVSTYYQQPLSVGIAFFLGVSSLMAAPYYVAFAACYRRLARAPAPLVPLLAGAAWAGAEMARVNLGGNPWAISGYSQIGTGPLVQIADVTGVHGLGFLLAAVNAALLETWRALRTDRARRPRAAAALAVAAAAVALAFGYGLFRLRSPVIDADAKPIRVAMVQGNLDLGSQWRQDFYGRNLDVYLQLTHEVLRNHAPAMVFWPENALTFFLPDEPLYREVIGRLLAPTGAQLVTGGPRTTGGRDARYYNSVFLLSPEGTIAGWYDKQRLVPFAEYFPFAGLESLQRRFARIRVFTPGDGAPLLRTAAGPAGVTICNEAMFPEIPAARVRAGATYLVDPANDTWLSPAFSAQQFEIVSLRTVEQRRYLVRASTSGPSAIVDPYGRVVMRTEFFTKTAIAGEIRPSTVRTAYSRVGDLFGILCAAIAVGACLSPALRPDREREA